MGKKKNYENNQEKYLFSVPVKKAPKSKTYRYHKQAYYGARSPWRERSPDGRLNLWGVYNGMLAEIQNERFWERETCEMFDDLMSQYVAGAFIDMAYEDICIEDIMEWWDNVEKTIPSMDKREKIVRLMRIVVDHAYEKKYSLMCFWGMEGDEDEANEPDTNNEVGDEDAKEEKEAKRYAERGVKIGRSLPLETQIRMFLWLMDNAKEHGECFAALIMNDTGVRTSEATAFNFEHLVELEPGCWALVRLQVSEKDSRETAIGGKSKNAYRILPISSFLARLILKKKEMLKETYGDEVNELPISCCGTKYKTRCYQKDVNRVMIACYKEIGAKKAMIDLAYEELRSDPKLAESCDKSLVAYLARHQVATDMEAIGMTKVQIQAVLGHGMDDQIFERYDFSNRDTFIEVAEKMRSRPIVQLLDKIALNKRCVYIGGREHFCSDSNMQLDVMMESAHDVAISVRPKECGELVGLQVDDRINVERLDVAGGMHKESIGITPILRALANEKWKKCVGQKDYEVLSPSAVAADLDWLKARAGNPSAKVIKLDDGASACDNVIQRTMVLGARHKTGMALHFSGELYLPTEAGKIYSISNGTLQNRGTKGRRPEELNRKEKVLGMFTWDSTKPAYVVSADGMLYQVPKESDFSSEDVCSAAWHDAMLKGGTLIYAGEEGEAVLCLGNDGNISATKWQWNEKFPENGVRLVRLEAGERIVSACICKGGEDVLLLSRKGKALRMCINEKLIRVKGGAKLVRGISLKNDVAMACCRFEPTGEYVCVTAHGNMVRLLGERNGAALLNVHNRGGDGVALVDVGESGGVVGIKEYDRMLIAVSSDGRLLCTDIENVGSVARNAKGIRCMSLTPGSTVLGFATHKAATLEGDNPETWGT